jgi:hypothetical protein
VGVRGIREYEFFPNKVEGEGVVTFEEVKPTMIDLLTRNILEDIEQHHNNIRVQMKISVGAST